MSDDNDTDQHVPGDEELADSMGHGAAHFLRLMPPHVSGLVALLLPTGISEEDAAMLKAKRPDLPEGGKAFSAMPIIRLRVVGSESDKSRAYTEFMSLLAQTCATVLVGFEEHGYPADQSRELLLNTLDGAIPLLRSMQEREAKKAGG